MNNFDLVMRSRAGSKRESLPSPTVPGGLGQPLETSVRRAAQQLLGHDFSHVRIHADADAARSAEALKFDRAAAEPTIDGFWIRFVSSIDSIDYPSESDNHLRCFRSRLGWPSTMHSRPNASHAIFWPTGSIRHDRSLDEMILDYLRYYRLGLGDPGWEAHNRVMIHDACTATAAKKGWDYVHSFHWWPEAASVAFDDELKGNVYGAK